jgi:hypothetical protein
MEDVVMPIRIEQNPLHFPEIGSGVRRALLQRFPYAMYFVVITARLLLRFYISTAILTRGKEALRPTTLTTGLRTRFALLSLHVSCLNLNSFSF